MRLGRYVLAVHAADIRGEERLVSAGRARDSASEDRADGSVRDLGGGGLAVGETEPAGPLDGLLVLAVGRARLACAQLAGARSASAIGAAPAAIAALAACATRLCAAPAAAHPQQPAPEADRTPRAAIASSSGDSTPSPV